MISSYNDIVNSIQSKKHHPVYVLDGEEPYYFDKLIQLFEHKILSEEEKDFNLSVLYGRDVQWAEVINACRRFPMFAEKQVVILKDAASMNGFNELAAYIKQPSETTIFIIEYRNKKIDGKTTISKIIKEKAAYFTSDKIKDDQMPKWIVRSRGCTSSFVLG
jgi:DNA polymerase-3 subunit delta